MSRIPNFDVRNYILVWGGDVIETIQSIGEQVCLPPHDVVATVGQPGAPTRFRFPAALDEQGKPMPGTVILKDVTRFTDAQQRVKSFDAERFVTLFAENQARVENDGIFGRGLAIVATPAEARARMEQCRADWVGGEVKKDEETVESFRRFKANWREKNNEDPPYTPMEGQAKEAAARLKRYRLTHAAQQFERLSDEDMSAALGRDVAAPPAAVLKRAAPAPADAAPAPAENLSVATYKEAQRLGIRLKAAQLAGLLDGNDAVVLEVMELVENAKAKATTSEDDKDQAQSA